MCYTICSYANNVNKSFKIFSRISHHYEWQLESLEVMPDHVHIFIQADPQTAPVEIAKALKSISAVHLFTLFPDLKRRKFWGSGLWSRGTYYEIFLKVVFER